MLWDYLLRLTFYELVAKLGARIAKNPLAAGGGGEGCPLDSLGESPPGPSPRSTLPHSKSWINPAQRAQRNGDEATRRRLIYCCLSLTDERKLENVEGLI